jgi:hypothetical protein
MMVVVGVDGQHVVVELHGTFMWWRHRGIRGASLAGMCMDVSKIGYVMLCDRCD